MLKTRRNRLLIVLMMSIFLGYMLATTGGFFIPGLRMVAAPLLCDGELEQRLPMSNRRLNLYCHPAEGGEATVVPFVPYLLATTLSFTALAFIPFAALLWGLLWWKGADALPPR